MGVAVMANKQMLFVMFVDDLEQFSLVSTDWLHLYLQVAQKPSRRDLAIFMVMTTAKPIILLHMCMGLYNACALSCMSACMSRFLITANPKDV